MYKAPETRIEVQSRPGVRPHKHYYAQYKEVWIWGLLEKWYNISGGINDSFEYTCSLDEAKERIDHFLRKDKDDYERELIVETVKKAKVHYEFIPYP